MMQDDKQSPRYLTASQVKARFGNISDMTLWRWLQDEALGFPKPMVVNRRRLFREDQVIDWEARQHAEAGAA